MPVRARFANDPFSVVEARQLVEAAVRGCPDTVAQEAALLTSELVSNAVLHARTAFEIVVDVVATGIRVAVSDRSTEPPMVQEPHPERVGGRGLLLVSRLADRWGFERRRDGKTVWFELDLATRAP